MLAVTYQGAVVYSDAPDTSIVDCSSAQSVVRKAETKSCSLVRYSFLLYVTKENVSMLVNFNLPTSTSVKTFQARLDPP